MKAVVAAVDRNAPPPKELSLAWNCRGWNTLPESGGYYDQDYRTMMMMNVAHNTYSAVSKVRNAKGSQIHSLTDSERRILEPLVEEGLI